MRIDLHTHSNVSDGTETPTALMRVASAAGLDVVGLSDHDTAAGWAEASDEAALLGMEFVPGIEVSCKWAGKSVHLLALWPNPRHPELSSMLKWTRASRVDRAKEMVARLNGDFPLEWESVLAQSNGAETVGRPHIADALVDAGVVANRDAAFAELLGVDSPYYVPHYAPDVVEAVSCIRRAGGVPVVAHPGAEARGNVLTDAAIGDLARSGLVGLEVDHRDHSEEQRVRLAKLAVQFGLIRTGASDYHGTGKLNRMGENLTTAEAYRALLEERR